MPKIYFIFGVHNHQPVGNDPFVFREAFDKCYKPFVDVLSEFPKIKLTMHFSGPLFDWMMENEKEFIARLKQLIERNQIEMIGGGYYEPILPIISDEDKLSQIRLMNDFIKKEFNKAPRGIWIAERVWEQHLASVISRAGLKYTFLDDTHFRHAGIEDKNVSGYYYTEDSSKKAAVFPISKILRYKMPFSKAEEAIALLKSFSQTEDVLITFFDDGEKFGSWPFTFDWVYKKEWLRKFLGLLTENIDYIQTVTPQEALKKFKSNGLVYLPDASYEEMGEWVLEPEALSRYKELKENLKKQTEYVINRNFLRTGFFRNFYRKYPRLNYMHKKMLYLAERIRKKASIKKDKEIYRHLWKAQCNCGYWHGVFGGFYLGNIRASIYENLIKAEKEMDEKFEKRPLIVHNEDFDFDGLPETVVKNKRLIASFSRRGATLLELSYKDRNFNLLNTITRRKESYHERIRGKAKKEIVYDKYEKLCLVDHLLGKKINIRNFARQRKIKTISNDFYRLSIAKKEKSAILNYGYESKDLNFSKKISLDKTASMRVRYIFEKCDIFKKYNFAIEFNIFLQSFDDVEFFSEKGKFELRTGRVFRKIKNLRIKDHFKNIYSKFYFDEADMFIMPLYSIASSENGLEKSCQQVTILFIPNQNGKTDQKKKDRTFSLGWFLSGKDNPRNR